MIPGSIRWLGEIKVVLFEMIQKLYAYDRNHWSSSLKKSAIFVYYILYVKCTTGSLPTAGKNIY